MDYIDTPANKSVLWEVLLEHGAFVGIDDSHFDRIRELFDTIVRDVVGRGASLPVEANKQILRDVTGGLNQFRGRPVTGSTATGSTATGRPVLREAAIKQRTDDLTDRTTRMVEEFHSFDKPVPKKEVRFTDDVEKMSPGILEERLQRAVALRELDVVPQPRNPSIGLRIDDIGSAVSSAPTVSSAPSVSSAPTDEANQPNSIDDMKRIIDRLEQEIGLLTRRVETLEGGGG
jgi:hypothetical protein